MKIRSFGTLASAALVSVGVCGGAMAQQADMTFFVTSAGSGKGADFGGLAGADQHCQTLAAAAGAGSKTWRAYLSASAAGSTPAVNAKDRIGKGPWQNAKGVVDRQGRRRAARHQQSHQADGADGEGRRSSTAAATRRTSTTS